MSRDKNILKRIYRKLERKFNQSHRYDFAPVSGGWIKHANSPVWGNKASGSMFDPYCFVEDDVFKMLVSDRKNGSLVMLRSDDGEKWCFENSIIQGTSDGSWESTVNRGCLLPIKGKYYLWFTGQNKNGCKIGLAISEDGKSFRRVFKAPIIIPDKDFEGASVMNPCVIYDKETNRMKMWYSAGGTYEPDVICYAESADGITWEKHAEPVMKKHSKHEWEKYKVGGCQVIKTEDGYLMYYIGYQNLDVARICVAHSVDGINWTRDDDNLIISPTKGSWDSDAVYKPSVVKKDGVTYLWYNGRRGNEEYIGLALKQNV